MAITMGNPDWHMSVPLAHLLVLPSATASQVYTGPCLYHGSLVAALGAVITSIKDGDGTNSNGQIDILDINAPIGTYHVFPSGVQCQYGIIIPLGLTRSAIHVYYRPISALFPFPYQ
jgi:hypothetical protein